MLHIQSFHQFIILFIVLCISAYLSRSFPKIITIMQKCNLFKNRKITNLNFSTWCLLRFKILQVAFICPVRTTKVTEISHIRIHEIEKSTYSHFISPELNLLSQQIFDCFGYSELFFLRICLVQGNSHQINYFWIKPPRLKSGTHFQSINIIKIYSRVLLVYNFDIYYKIFIRKIN